MSYAREANNDRFQFGIRRLMVLALAVAVVLSISVRIGTSPIPQVLFAVWLGSIVGWAIIRGPRVCAKLAAARLAILSIKERRAELEREARDAKSVIRK